jgi:hypothetical protein
VRPGPHSTRRRRHERGTSWLPQADGGKDPRRRTRYVDASLTRHPEMPPLEAFAGAIAGMIAASDFGPIIIDAIARILRER